MAVDPSAQTVLTLLRKHATSLPPQRILIHYFGHGCHPPTEDGSLYFFSEDRTRYKPIKIINLLNSCPCPLCVIIDAPNAGCLPRFFSSKSDAFAFFACGASETLPLSIDAPLDLFSACLLTPFETAIWFHRRHHSNVLEFENSAVNNNKDVIKKFLDAFLDAILFDSQISAIYEKFAFDTSVFALARGFVLAQRILNSFNIHPSTYPELKNMSSHPLWGMWDTAIDCFLTMPLDRSMITVFKIFSKSFSSFPSTDSLPIFSFYLRTEFHQDAVHLLLNFIDSTEGAASTCSRSSIPKIIVNLEKPSAASLVIVAKCIASEKISPFDPQIPINFQNTKDPGVLKAGFLCLALSISITGQTAFSRLIPLCIEKATQCAPYSALFLGLLLERASRLMTIPEYISKFMPLVKSRRDDYRAAAAFLFGFAKEPEVLNVILSMTTDKSPVVRCQALWSVAKFIKHNMLQPEQAVLDMFKEMQNDKAEFIVKTATGLLPYFADERFKDQNIPQDQMLIQRLILNVNAVGFMERFESDAFLCDASC